MVMVVGTLSVMDFVLAGCWLADGWVSCYTTYTYKETEE
jgi:hypothetical protein